MATGASINLDLGDNLNEVIGAAILQTLDTAKRDQLIAEAIAFLLTPPPNTNYGSPKPKSPLQVAFDIAVQRVATEVVHKRVQEDLTIRAQLEKLFADAWEKANDEAARQDMVTHIASVMADALTGDHRRR